jgi:spore germination protein
VFGLYGVTWGLLLATVYLCSLDSFGVPYLAPLAPLRPRGLQDTLWRRPFPRMRRSFLARRAQEPGHAP